ncbi:MAG: menaquinone biosynthesis decarboxylase, partial [Candidatus Altarchaeaceae archaeon]
LWSLTQMMFVKIIIVVDKFVNVQNLNEVLFYVSSNVDPKRDILIIENSPIDVLDHTSSLKFLGSKVGIDATRKFEEEGVAYPEEVKMDEQVIEKVNKILKNLKF